MSEADILQCYAIYHATDIMAMLFPSPDDWLSNRDQHYQHVANVSAPLACIFALTNHTDGHNWTSHPEVSWVSPDLSPRSTSVGDVISCPVTGHAWLVMPVGLQEISPSLI